MNDKIFINDIEVFAKHGVFAKEKGCDQKFLITVIAKFEADSAKLSDNISDTINYVHLLNTVVSAVKSSSFNLIERLARNIADVIFNKFNKITSADIIIKKFPKDLENIKFSEIGFSSTFLRDEK